ncbi:calponin-3 isoform X2 [Saimiri boliviensis]
MTSGVSRGRDQPIGAELRTERSLSPFCCSGQSATKEGCCVLIPINLPGAQACQDCHRTVPPLVEGTGIVRAGTSWGRGCRRCDANYVEIASKYDHQAEEDLRNWIEEVTGMSIGTNFQLGLKDGIILCELINKLQPGSVKKVNESSLNWPQLENIGNFIKAIQAYGMKPHDIFEANDLFENGNMTQVQTTLVALAGLAKTKGFHTTIDIGVKYAEKQTRRFDEGKLKAGQSVIGLQMGTNKCASQAGMTAYGTRRHLYDPKMQTDKPFDQTTISLQMGTNKGASQAGMLAPGTRRDIYDQKLTLQPVDNSTISLQMGTNKVASQKGMSVYGLGRQVYDPKYCAAPTEPVIHNGSQGTGTNGSEISDSDYQAEYPDEYHGEYQDDYPRDYPYSDQGIDY